MGKSEKSEKFFSSLYYQWLILWKSPKDGFWRSLRSSRVRQPFGSAQGRRAAAFGAAGVLAGVLAPSIRRIPASKLA